MTTDHMQYSVRISTSADASAAIALLDAAMLSFNRDAVRHRAGTDALYVVTNQDGIVGAALLAGQTLEAIAVTPRLRNNGIGTRLVQSILADRDRLVATCRPSVEPFYAALGARRWRLPDGQLLVILDGH